VVRAQPSVVNLVVTPSSGASYDTQGPYSRVWVRHGASIDQALQAGQWKAGHQLLDRFEVNAGRYDPRFDKGGSTTWATRECRYLTTTNNVPPTFVACYKGISSETTRTDAPDTFVAGSEITAVTNIQSLLIGDTGGATNPQVLLGFQVQTYTYRQQLSWYRDGLQINFTNPNFDKYPPGVGAAAFFANGFVQSTSRISEIGSLFSNNAVYTVFDATVITNDGTSTDAIQSYVNEGDPASADPVFYDTAILQLNIMQIGPHVCFQAFWLIFNPHYSSTNPFRIVPSHQTICLALDPYGKAQAAEQGVDLLYFFLGGQLEPNTLNVTALCELMQRTCLNTLEQPHWPYQNTTCLFPLASDPTNPQRCSLQQYTSVGSCVSYVGSLVVGTPSTSTGATQQCFKWHLAIAAASALGATEHCLHSGAYHMPPGLPFNIHTPCQ